MATRAQNKKKKNSKKRKSREQAPLVDEAKKRINRFRQELATLEWDAKFSEEKGEREKALLSILEKNDGLHLKQEDIAERSEMIDACHFALERIATYSKDMDIRQRAFSFVQFNPVAALFVHDLTPYPDIKRRARDLKPTEPNEYYESMGVPESNGENYKGISTRILAHLRKDILDPGERSEMLGKARRLIKRGSTRWGPTQEVIRDLMKKMSEKLATNGEKKFSRNDLADCVESFLSGKPDGKPVKELEASFEEVRKMRI